MKRAILKIEGMSCSACSNALEKYLNKQKGINMASVNLVLAESLIEYDDSLTIDDLNRFVSEAGYKSLGVYNDKETHDNSKYYLIIFGILAIILMYISMQHMFNLPIISFLNVHKNPLNYGIFMLILSLVFLIYGSDIIISGIKKLIHKTPNMDSLVTIGVLASFIYSVINLILIILNNIEFHNLYFESVVMIIYFIKLGRYIDKQSRSKAKLAIKQLVKITPDRALLKKENEVKEVTIDEVKVGDILKCMPGMKIAVDGVITKGITHVDETFITGESSKNKKEPNDKVIAGSINIDGTIEYKAEKIGKDSTISEIIKLVVESANTKAPIQKIVDIVSSYFIPSIIIIAILTLITYLILGKSFNEAIISFVTVLTVACPCALGLATPLAIVVSNGEAAKKGILIKSSEVLEKIKDIDTIIFDKTGTLTYGDLRIAKINNYSTYKEDKLIQLIASLESNSSHPIASAFNNYALEHKTKLSKVDNFKNITGMGITGNINNKKIYVGNDKLLTELKIKNNYKDDYDNLISNGNSAIYIIENEKIIALISISDVIRNNAKNVIKKLQDMNKKIIILSGDNNKVVNIVAKTLNIKEVVSDALPKGKDKYLKKLKSLGHKIMMVGDGINDALSLTTADIGVSLNGATDVAIDSAEVILMNDNLDKIIDLFNISKFTIKIIKQNLFWAFFYNILMIPIAIGLLKPFGIMISPSLASISMMISSLSVVFNCLRLKKII